MSEKATQDTISFIVPVLNGERFIEACLEALSREAGDRDEIIVVDNGSTDATLDLVRRWERVRLIEMPGVTIAALRNRGAEVASAPILAFIDADCLLCPGWREAAIGGLSDPAVHSTGSRYDIPPQATWIERSWYSKKAGRPKPIHYINSGNLVVRADAFATLGGFDTRLVTDEDFDFGSRLNDRGMRMIEDPRVRVIHLGNAKTLGQFFRKIRWHATSGIKLRTGRHLDKPMLMTLAFIVSWVAAVMLLPFTVPLGPGVLWLAIGSLVSVPLVTALYRVRQFGNYPFLPHLVVLYTVYYLARAVTVLQYWIARTQPERA